MTAQFAIVVQAQADFICLILKGELDLAALPDLETAFARIAGDHPERAVQVDLTNAPSSIPRSSVPWSRPAGTPPPAARA